MLVRNIKNAWDIHPVDHSTAGDHIRMVRHGWDELRLGAGIKSISALGHKLVKMRQFFFKPADRIRTQAVKTDQDHVLSFCPGPRTKAYG